MQEAIFLEFLGASKRGTVYAGSEKV